MKNSNLNPSDKAAAAEETVPFHHPYRWVVLVLTATTFLLTFVVRFAWSPLIPAVVPALKMSMSQAGAFMSAFYIGYVITQVPAGILADRFGVRLILGTSLVLEGVSTYTMGYVDGFQMGFGLRVAAGLGAGAVFSACAKALMEWIPPRERGTAFGVLLAAPSAGILISGWIVPILEKHFQWQGAFRGVGLFSAAIGILLFFLIRSSGETRGQNGMFAGFKIVFRSKEILMTSLAGFFRMWILLGTATWTFAHIEHLGFSRAVAGGVLVLYGLGGLVAPLLSGFLSDRIGHRKHIIIISLAVSAPVTIIFGYQNSVAALSLVGFFFGFCSYFANPHFCILISEFAGERWTATATGTANFISQMASIIGPVVMGWSIDMTGSFSSVWWIMAAGPLAAILLLLPVNPHNARG